MNTLINQHIARNRITFPSPHLEAVYRANWRPNDYQLTSNCECCDKPNAEELIQTWDGGTELYCLACAAVYLRAVGGDII